MKILAVEKDNRITGVEYRVIETSTKPIKNNKEQLFKTKYTDAQFNQLKKMINRTKHK